MYKLITIFCIVATLVSCKHSNRKTPDISKINAPLQVIRFERDVFANNAPIDAKMNNLDQKYGSFTKDYLFNIVGISPSKDSILRVLPLFIDSYRAVYDSVQITFSDEKLNKDLEPLKKALQLTKYYFPQYKTPAKLFTFVGPLDGYGCIMTSSGLAVGLQLYLGKDFPAYHTEYVQQVYPNYISRRFEPEYIPVNCVRNIVEDIFVDEPKSLPLVEQMIDAGKKLYIMDYLLPDLDESFILGYTKEQAKGCIQNEATIWNFFLQNNLLYSTDAESVRDYLNDGPNTPALGDNVPGNIGQFVGLQIVKKWMNEHTQTSFPDLVKTSSAEIFKQSKYKPH